MKHFGRWMICLGLFLNPCLFIALIATGAALNTTLLAIAIACYPFALGLIALARKYINSKCCFYRDSDSFWGKVLKTIFMPIVAAGALIMFHLITTTYREMNEAIEDKTGFSVSSIFRTLIALLVYAVASIALFLITESTIVSNASEVGVGFMVFGGIVFVSSHILWDILDFAQKESNGFILFKNITFTVIGVLAFLMGIIMFISFSSFEATFENMFRLTSIVSAPICLHFAYYGIIRTGQVPQSKLTFFWGPIAMIVTLGYTYLISLIAESGIAWVIIFHVLVFLIYGVLVFFKGFPFVPTDGEYRIAYREIAKEKRIAMARSGETYKPHYDYSTDTSPDEDPNTDYISWDVASKISRKYSGYGKSIHLSASASINGIDLTCTEATKDSIIYTLRGTLYADIRGMDSTAAELFLSNTATMAGRKLNDLANEIIRQTQKELNYKNVNYDGLMVEVNPDLDEDIVCD